MNGKGGKSIDIDNDELEDFEDLSEEEEDSDYENEVVGVKPTVAVGSLPVAQPASLSNEVDDKMTTTTQPTLANKVGYSFWDDLQQNFEQFMENITPDTQAVDRNDLRKYGLKYFITIIYYVSFIIAFTWLYYWSFNKAINAIYLAPTSEDPPSNCVVKSVVLSGKYYIDSNGYWEGSKEYDMAKRLYVMEFKRVSIGKSEYEDMVRHFQSELRQVSAIADQRDLTFSKVIWSSFKSRYYQERGSIDFYLIGDAKYLLKMKVFRTYFAGAGQVCIPPQMTAAYNPQAAAYEVRFKNTFYSDYDSLIKSNQSRIKYFEEPCPDLFLLDGDLSSDPADETVLHFDARTIMTSIAVNYNLTKTSALVKVGSHQNFSLDFYVDNTYYEDMDPIVCLQRTAMCGMVIGNQILIPFLVSQGYENTQRKCAFDFYKRCGTNACREEFFFMNSLLVFVFVPFSDLVEGGSPAKGPKLPEDPIENLINYDYSDYYYAAEEKTRKRSTLGTLRAIMHNLRSLGFDNALDTVYSAADASYFPAYYANLFQTTTSNHDASYWLRNLSLACPDHDFHAQIVNQLCLGEACTLMVMATSHEKDFFTTSAGLRINAFGNTWHGKQESVPWWDISIYNEYVFEKMARNPPVDLFESVMQCRKSYSQAAIDILGITFSITRLLSSIVFSITIAIVVFVYNNYIVKKTGVRRVVKKDKKERKIRNLMVHILSKTANRTQPEVKEWVEELEQLCNIEKKNKNLSNEKVAPEPTINNFDGGGNYVAPSFMFS